jgi:hypothetical protein
MNEQQLAAVKLALVALEEWYFGCGAGSESHDDAVEAIKQALAAQPAPVQEPHKGLSEHLAQATNGRVRIDPVTGNVGIGTAPVQEPWVGLTNNELQPIADEYRILFGGWVEDFARAIEAKLKEKNHV